MNRSLETSPGVAKALGYLANQAERSRLESLTEADLVVLRDSFSSGVKVVEFKEALQRSRGKDPLSVLGPEGRRAIVRPTTKKVFVVAYLTSQDVRNAYPISQDEFNRVKSLFDGGSHESAVSALQTAISGSLEKSGKTRTVEVRLGVLPTKDVTSNVLRSLMDSLPQQMQSMNISCVGSSEGYEAYVQKHTVTGLNRKHVGAAARILTYYLNEGKDIGELKKVPGVSVEKDSD
ncbi:hypothetical protein [Hadaka virus 1]|uniref:Uncharacterized protein n=1 Tax=Hadaka virus 1 TaxID=2703488 RepID=A0A6J4BJL4_9VIRU|nr:hypothetical protein QK729_s5gp1 [Hadaka virus 1]BBU94042.1 hypothetical protein [Hadaka virus 1]